ncbi:hypothetical protein JL108_07305 [Aeromicrobium sp. YIM 150415]|uniref:hypothetical protein n=1 Tax=Aeromicrobium sp. YIM 150415 TaxID=2803912 RepID=UPI001964941F|nr:hypothetical protein [Aeromicrobium sp. YIM 150415]MBM9463252.1 hypothetical protein [Aeromicrobium sp. YIM 150415]
MAESRGTPVHRRWPVGYTFLYIFILGAMVVVPLRMESLVEEWEGMAVAVILGASVYPLIAIAVISILSRVDSRPQPTAWLVFPVLGAVLTAPLAIKVLSNVMAAVPLLGGQVFPLFVYFVIAAFSAFRVNTNQEPISRANLLAPLLLSIAVAVIFAGAVFFVWASVA